MNGALSAQRNWNIETDNDACATPGDFQQLFATRMNDLFRLSMQLTADADSAESCLILAMRDCFSRRTVPKKWAQMWARRMVVRNAIRVVLSTKNGIPDDLLGETASDFHLQPSEYRIEILRDSPAIHSLPDFDRLVFVISVLERYSILDCALLLSRSPKDVLDARERAASQIIPAQERNHHETFKTLLTRTCGACCDEGGDFDDSCGTILG